MRILITGGSGFIGTHLAAYLDRKGHAITLFDLKQPKEQKGRSNDIRFVRGDITDAVALDAAIEGHDAVVHLAAMVSVPETIADPKRAIAVNEHGSLNVLRAAQRHKLAKAIFASSAAVYGENPTTPTSEEAPARPMSPYAETKLAMERHAREYANKGLPTCCLRFFNVYGPGQDPKSQYAAVIPAFIARALAGEDIKIYGDGEQTRDFIYVEDVCRACELALTIGGGEYNIATGECVTVNELAKTIVALAHGASAIVHLPARQGDPRASRAAVEKAQRELGFCATTRLADGLRETVDALRQPKMSERRR